jgi:hypothetical protein
MLLGALLCAMCFMCRLPKLSTICIDLDGDIRNGGLDPVLLQMQLHATGLHSLRLQLNSSWSDLDGTWRSLGKLVSLTKLEMAFSIEVKDWGAK